MSALAEWAIQATKFDKRSTWERLAAKLLRGKRGSR